ncbi:MAG: hypothetical protein JWQ70_1942 [Aeromicrobium sp.]|nr:hypothetical protein [Aeromicrobium sp.]
MRGMNSKEIVSVLAMVFSVFGIVLSGWFSARTAKISNKIKVEADKQKEKESALAAAQRVYEPLAQAAAELQSRIYNIVETGWVALTKRYEGHGDYTVASTAFLFAHYFGWIEARRQSVLDSSGEGGRDENVQKLIDGVLKVLRRGDDSDGFCFFSAEQRAIGELMFFWEVLDGGLRIPHVHGYSKFATMYRDDKDFKRWFEPVDAGMARVAQGDNSRLIAIQRALVDLIRELDPNHKYTIGYTLAPISISVGEQPHADEAPIR